MGWASGSQLAESVYDLVRRYIPKKARMETAQCIIEIFEDKDADDWDSDSKLCKDAGHWQPED